MIDLRPDEKADITLVKVVDAYWKATGYHGWWNGPNALTQPDEDGFQHPPAALSPSFKIILARVC